MHLVEHPSFRDAPCDAQASPPLCRVKDSSGKVFGAGSPAGGRKVFRTLMRKIGGGTMCSVRAIRKEQLPGCKRTSVLKSRFVADARAHFDKTKGITPRCTYFPPLRQAEGLRYLPPPHGRPFSLCAFAAMPQNGHAPRGRDGSRHSQRRTRPE